MGAPASGLVVSAAAPPLVAAALAFFRIADAYAPFSTTLSCGCAAT